MSKTPPPADLESIWAEIQLLLEWQQGFGFYLVFGDDYRVSRQLRQRIEDATRARTGQLRWLRPDNPATALGDIMHVLLPELADGEQPKAQAPQAPLWLELTAYPGNPEWEQTRRHVLSVLNRRRSALEQRCPRPLFLQLPEALAPEIVTWAPDLWSVRQYVAVLPRQAPEPSLADGPEQFRKEAATLVEHANTLLDDGDLSHALPLCRASVERFRQLREHLGDTPQTLRDLSVSLDTLGDAERQAGQFDDALATYQESFALRQQLRTSLGDAPQVLRDLFVSLNKLGDAQQQVGQFDDALVTYQESLSLARQLRASLGDTPQVLRDLSISLEKLGDAQQETGQLDAALTAYQESLSLARQLQANLGDTPQVLRDLLVSLNRLGNVHQQTGQLDAALAAYQESLSLARQLRASLGDTPQVLRDLSVSLYQLGQVGQQAGNPQAALSLFQQDLALSRQLRAALGDTWQTLKDLATSLNTVQTLKTELGEQLSSEESTELAELEALLVNWHKETPDQCSGAKLTPRG